MGNLFTFALVVSLLITSWFRFRIGVSRSIDPVRLCNLAVLVFGWSTGQVVGWRMVRFHTIAHNVEVIYNIDQNRGAIKIVCLLLLSRG